MIKSYEIKINGQSFNSSNFTTNALTGNGTCTVKITDTRNRAANKSISYSVVYYSNPTINNFSVVRCSEDGTQNDEGAYAKCILKASISSVNNKNDKTFQLLYKKLADSSYTTINLSNSSYSYNSTQIIAADINSEYEFIFKVKDYFSTVQKSLNLGTAFTLLDFNASGRGIAIGRVSSENCFQVAMDIKQKNYFNGRRCQYVPETVDGTKSGWFLVLHGENNVQYDNYACLLAVTQVHSGSGNYASGIISLNIRVDNYNMFAVDFRMVCGNLSADKFRLVCSSYTDFYVYARTDGT